MRSWLLLPVAIAAVALVTPAPAQAQAQELTVAAAQKSSKPRTAKRVSPQANGHVYLLRGLLNIFSLGMDDLASKIQAKGISASVHNHSEWQGLADAIAVKYKAREHGPIVLVGHSLGADAVMFMAEYLGKKGVPVALVVPFDGTGSFAASSNVGQVYNLTQRDYAYMRKGAGFRGTLQNVDVSRDGYGHIDIDKAARLHAMVLQRIQSVIRTRGAPRPEGDHAPAPRPRPAPAQQDVSPAPATAPSAVPATAAAPATPAVSKPAATEAAPAASKPAPAEAAPAAKPAPATTGSTTANVAPVRAASSPPPVSRPATTDSNAKRSPANSEAGARPALRF